MSRDATYPLSVLLLFSFQVLVPAKVGHLLKKKEQHLIVVEFAPDCFVNYMIISYIRYSTNTLMFTCYVPPYCDFSHLDGFKTRAKLKIYTSMLLSRLYASSGSPSEESKGKEENHPQGWRDASSRLRGKSACTNTSLYFDLFGPMLAGGGKTGQL